MWLVLTLISIGAILLLLETILPGAIAGVVGMIFIGAGVVVAYRDLGVDAGNLILLAVLVGLVAGTMWWIKVFPNSRLTRRFVSKKSVGEIDTERPELLNQSGVALSNLRPSGMAVINQKRVDVVTEGPMIERGRPVKVVAVEGMRVVVRAA